VIVAPAPRAIWGWTRKGSHESCDDHLWTRRGTDGFLGREHRQGPRAAAFAGDGAVAWIQMGDWCASSDTKPMKTGVRKRHDT